MSRTTVTAVVVTVAIAGALMIAGCAPQAQVTPGDSEAGSQLAQGLHDRGDGTVQAVGVLSYQDLEGGFWAVTSTSAQGDPGAVIAVVTNAEDFERQIAQLADTQVIVTGRRLEGASIRMAGPELEASTVEAYKPSTDPAK